MASNKRMKRYFSKEPCFPISNIQNITTCVDFPVGKKFTGGLRKHCGFGVVGKSCAVQQGNLDHSINLADAPIIKVETAGAWCV